MSKIILNIVEPGSSTPIDPVVPNTGLFTSTHGGGVDTIIIVTSIVVILAIVAAIILSYKKKHNKDTETAAKSRLAGIFSAIKSKKKVSIPLAVLALVVSLGTLAALLVNAGKSNTSAAEGGLTVTTTGEEKTIEVGDSPVFAIAEVEVTVEEATQAGYTLTAYTEDTNLVSTTDNTNIIPMVAADEGELVALADNTYGLALSEPTTKDEAIYTILSTDSSTPTLITDKAYEATEEDDTTTIYYGFYITPDMPKGTYVSNSEVVYDAIPNLATVTFDANGLYYNNDESLTTNTIGYKPNVAEAPIELVTGEYLTPAPLNSDSSSSSSLSLSSSIHYTFLGWSEDKDATEATYVDEEDILANLTLTKNESLTLYAVWHYDTVLSFNGNTSDGGTPIEDITIAAGETITLPQNTYTRTGSVFTNWNTVETPTAEDPGEDYEDQADFTAPNESADITLYAQWAYTTTITFNGNGADSGSMSDQTIVAGTPETLTPNTFTKTNATFVGWNTVQNPTTENPGTSYSDQAEFIASTTQHEDITLYAQWAYTTISFNGNTSDSGTMNPIIIPGGEQVTLPQNAYTKSHCSFTSWNTNPDGTGTRYPGEASYTASMEGIYSFTLYAQWQCESMINFNGNGADSGYMAGIMATGGEQTTLPQNTFTKEDYTFTDWNTAPDGTGDTYLDQGTYIAPASESQNITLYAQWLPTTTITFNDNGATSGTMSPQTIVAGTPQNLTPNAFTKDGYIFNGWNTVQTPTLDNPGTAYADKAQYTASTTQPESITLYAQWKQVFYMQDVATWGSTLSQGDTMEAIDKRDGQEYTVARLADNKIWMTKNLNLAGGTEITSELSNVPDGYTLPTANGFQSGNKLPVSSTYGFNNNTRAFVYNSTKTSGTDCTSSGCYSYYSWTAATAGSGLSNTDANTDAPYSICPKGWKLPSTRYTSAADWKTESDFYKLAIAYGMDPSSNYQSTANFYNQAGPGTTPNFLLTGYLSYGSFYRDGSYGHYWSSTGKTYIGNLNFNSSYVNSADSGFRGDAGFAVRCIVE